MASGVHSLTVPPSSLKGLHGVIALSHHHHEIIRKANNPSNKVRGSESKPLEKAEELSEWEEEVEIPLPQLQKRQRDEERPKVKPELSLKQRLRRSRGPESQ